jgi:hypothetical protein
MRNVLASLTVVMLAGIGSGFAVSDAAALPKVEASKVDSGLAENIGWRRDYRRYGHVAVAPRERYYRRHGTVAVEPSEPVVAVLGPGSCGEFKYWDGTTCVDKRYIWSGISSEPLVLGSTTKGGKGPGMLLRGLC